MRRPGADAKQMSPTAETVMVGTMVPLVVAADRVATVAGLRWAAPAAAVPPSARTPNTTMTIARLRDRVRI
jgi:hypothetical protein